MRYSFSDTHITHKGFSTEPASSEVGLDTLSPGESGIVVRVLGEGVLRRRLLDMGLTPGTVVKFVKAAPLGDPLELTLRGYTLSIRKAEAQRIILSKCS